MIPGTMMADRSGEDGLHGTSAFERLPRKAILPRVLCVDDDPAVLRATTRVLATRFDVTMAIGGRAALEVVRRAESPFAAVVSDLRMPELNGIGLLQCVRQHTPHTSRVLLTGNADVPSAVDAVNAGEIFRFLIKPCPPEALIEAVAAACAQHAQSERVVGAPAAPQTDDLQPRTVLANHTGGETAAAPTRATGDGEESQGPEHAAATTATQDQARRDSGRPRQLDGYVSVLQSVLATARPAANDCANRIERRVGHVLQHMHLDIAEHVGAAAALSQLGSIGLSADVAERIYGGWALSADDRACAAGIRPRSAELVSTSAELALVRAVLSPECLTAVELSTVASGSAARATEECETGARILDIACALDDVERRVGEGAAVKYLLELERNPGKHDSILVEAFRAALRAPTYDGTRTMRLRDARPNMVLAADVVAPNGLLVARRGQRVGDLIAMRTSTWSRGVLEQSVEVVEEPVLDTIQTGSA